MTNVAIVARGKMAKDGLFNVELARDGCLERFFLLRNTLWLMGMACKTADMYEAQEINVLIFHDIHQELAVVLRTIKANPHVLLMYIPNEPFIIAPLHEDTILPELPVDSVMTWNDRIAGRYPNVLKCNIGQPLINVENIPSVPFAKKQLILSIFSNRTSNVRGSLYRERIDAVDFFSTMPNRMDLYGIGWETSTLESACRSFKGRCECKHDVLQQYKYSIAYENTKGLPGLITEKIFDCFAAGTVPIYYGPPNVHDYIPKGCFIDFCSFASYEKLYHFLMAMSEEEYQAYLDAAKAFIKSKAYYEFTSKRFAEIVFEQIQLLLNEPPPNRTVLSFKWALIKIVLSHPIFFLKNLKQCRRFLFDLSFSF